MSDDIVITLKHVSKVFKRYHRPVDRLKEILLPGNPQADEFWALRDISFNVAKGETVGIIGRNGSGKSTLLQIIAGTLQPTNGEVKVAGRISALLELGSGFNPEFTGRQNVFFNGRILGLTQEEIEERFDEIAAFADIGEFIDQPVKSYSSGMFVRLAFAVAINVEPDILVVDEALSVGDEAFQRKCFARIFAIQEAGTSVLFVSHSAASIVELCNKALWIDQGEVLLNGTPKNVVAQYQRLIYAPADQSKALKRSLQTEAQQVANATSRVDKVAETDEHQRPMSGGGDALPRSFYDSNLKSQHVVRYPSRGAKIRNVQITTLIGEPVNLLTRRDRYIYTYSVYFSENCFHVRFGMLLKTVSGFELGGAVSHSLGNELPYISAGMIIDVKFEFPCLLLPGTYFANAGLLGRIDEADVYLDRCIDIVIFKVQAESNLHATGIVDFQIKPEISSSLIYRN